MAFDTFPGDSVVVVAHLERAALSLGWRAEIEPERRSSHGIPFRVHTPSALLDGLISPDTPESEMAKPAAQRQEHTTVSVAGGREAGEALMTALRRSLTSPMPDEVATRSPLVHAAVEQQQRQQEADDEELTHRPAPAAQSSGGCVVALLAAAALGAAFAARRA